MKIQLSFKQTETDMYKHVKKQLSESIYIKQLIKKDMEQQEPAKKNPFESFSLEV
jgi:hypothetical protein